jgi:hypothetical protein
MQLIGSERVTIHGAIIPGRNITGGIHVIQKYPAVSFFN